VTQQLDKAECPNWRQVMPSEDTAKTKLRFRQRRWTSYSTPAPVARQDGNLQAVRLEVDNQTFTVKGRSKDSPEWTSVVVPGVSIQGDPVFIQVNREFVLKR